MGDDQIFIALPIGPTIRAEQQLRDFMQTLTNTFSHLTTGLAVFDRDKRLALFNPALTDLTGELVLSDDGSEDPTLACQPLINSSEIAGKIALIDRGGCSFVEKIRHAQEAGAIAAVVANHTPGGGVFTMFPIAMCLVAGLLGLSGALGRED